MSCNGVAVLDNTATACAQRLVAGHDRNTEPDNIIWLCTSVAYRITHFVTYGEYRFSPIQALFYKHSGPISKQRRVAGKNADIHYKGTPY
jgi:hypothetical protein